jgi:hypothetical protein
MEVSKKTPKQMQNEIAELVAKPGYIYAYAAMVRNDNFIELDNVAEIDWSERLSYQEFSFLAGYLVKTKIDFSDIDEETALEYINSTYRLMSEMHMSHAMEMVTSVFDKLPSGTDPDVAFKQYFGAGNNMVEPIFYSDSGAYDFQYLDYAPKLYELDSKWLRENKGLDIELATKLYSRSNELMNAKSNALDQDKPFMDLARDVLNGHCISLADFGEFDTDDVAGYFEAFSLTPGGLNSDYHGPGDFNLFDVQPLIKIDDTRYFAPVHFNVARSIYESPFFWMLQDDAYRETAAKNRGDITEQIATEALSRVFNDVKTGVKLKRGKTDLTDMDTFVTLGNRGIIVQSKGKRLTIPARGGDEEKLKNDFENAVQSAYAQGLTTRNALLAGGVTIDEQSKVENGAYKDVYIICLSTDFYPAVSHQASAYLQKGTGDPDPLTISIFDLDLLCEYLADPYEFMFYIQRRVELSAYYSASNEMTLLGFHLRKRLYKQPGRDMEVIDQSFAQLIDADLLARRGVTNVPSPKHALRPSWTNENFDRLLTQIKTHRSPLIVDVVFFFMGLASDTVDRFTESMIFRWYWKTTRLA